MSQYATQAGLNSLHSSGWPLVHNPPAYSSRVLELQAKVRICASPYPQTHSCVSKPIQSSYLVGTYNKDNIVHVPVRPKLLLHFCQPQIQGIKRVFLSNVIDQYHTLRVLVKFISYLQMEEQRHKMLAL